MTTLDDDRAAPARLPPGLPTDRPSRPRRNPEGAVVVAVCAAVAAGAVLRHLGTKPLWRDEAISLSVAGRPVARILTILPRHDANAGLYYMLLHGWLQIGNSPAWARGFSALCLVATAVVAAWAGWLWRGSETGLACGLLVALNPFLLYYGQEARPYALATLLAAVATVTLFWRLGPDGRELAPVPFILASIGLIYTDLFAATYVGVLMAVVAAIHLRRREPVPGALTRGALIIAGVSAPLAAVMLLFERGQISWLARPDLEALVRTFTVMASGGLGLVLVLVLGGVALVTTGRDRPVVVTLAAAFGLPPLGLWTVAQVAPSFIDRYVICSAMAMVGLVAAGLTVLRDRLVAPAPGAGRLVAAVTLAGLLLLAARSTVRMEALPYKVDNGPAVVAFIQARAQPGDAVAYAGGGLRTLVEAMQPRAFPDDVALAPGGEASRQHDLYAREGSASQLAARLVAVQRLWLVTDPLDQRYPQGGPFAELRPVVATSFASLSTTSFGTIEVTLLVRSR